MANLKALFSICTVNSTNCTVDSLVGTKKQAIGQTHDRRQCGVSSHSGRMASARMKGTLLHYTKRSLSKGLRRPNPVSSRKCYINLFTENHRCVTHRCMSTSKSAHNAPNVLGQYFITGLRPEITLNSHYLWQRKTILNSCQWTS